MRDSKYEVQGGDGVFIVVDRGSGDVVATFYSETDLGWWRGHAFGRVRRLFLPGDSDPVTVAGKFLAS